MRILVTHATKSGFTATVAEWIADELRQTGHQVDAVEAGADPAPAGHQLVVIGSGIRAGHWHAPAVSWLERHADELGTIDLVTFTSSLQGGSSVTTDRDEAAGWTTAVLEPLGLVARAHAVFGGAYDPPRFGLAERMVMKVMGRAQVVDQRDEQEVRRWTREMIAEIC